jgi:hypothetical protein
VGSGGTDHGVSVSRLIGTARGKPQTNAAVSDDEPFVSRLWIRPSRHALSLPGMWNGILTTYSIGLTSLSPIQARFGREPQIPPMIEKTRADFIRPDFTGGSARGYWDVEPWRALAAPAVADGIGVPHSGQMPLVLPVRS